MPSRPADSMRAVASLKFPLRTKRLALRPFTLADFEALHAMLAGEWAERKAT